MTITKLSDEAINGEISRTNVAPYGEDKRYNSVRMEGKVSLSALLDFVNANATNIASEDIFINWGSVTWIDNATPEEIAKLAARKADGKAKLEAYERQKLTELLAKYGARPEVAESEQAANG